MEKSIKNKLIGIIIPVFFFLCMEVICLAAVGSHLIVQQNYLLTIRTLCINTFLAMALSCNIHSGRFDFSLGAVRICGVIMGGNLAVSLGFGGIGILFFSIVCGMLLSAVVGTLYCLTKINPIVFTLGMALIIEALSFSLNDAKGLNLIHASGTEILKNPWFMLGMILVCVVFMDFITRKTIFGYHQKALASGQNVAVNAGIGEKKNAILCYAISGGLAAAAGVISASYQGTMDPVLGLGSIGTAFSAMLPVFLGDLFAKYVSEKLALFIACIMVTLLNIGMSVLELTVTVQSLVNAIVLILFLILNFNYEGLKNKKLEMERKKLAEAER